MGAKGQDLKAAELVELSRTAHFQRLSISVGHCSIFQGAGPNLPKYSLSTSILLRLGGTWKRKAKQPEQVALEPCLHHDDANASAIIPL